MTTTLKHKIISGVFWQGLERFGSQGLSFGISIVLARLLAPEEFGVLAIMLVFVSISAVFVDSGFSVALIQKRDLDDIDCSSVFYLNIGISILLYGLLFFCAGPIGEFYNDESIRFLLRILGIILVIRSFSLVQSALLNKRMLFQLSFKISWTALIISGAVGIVMAYCGCGVWALIVQQLLNAVVTGIMLWLLVKWRPQAIFNFERMKSLFRFGGKMFCSGLLDTIYNNIYSILIGRLFSLTTLSFYNRGSSIPALVMGSINSTIGSVALPAFSQLQDEPAHIRKLAQRSLKTIMFLISPMLALLLIFATPLVRIILTDKWLPCVIFLQLNCLIFLFWPLHTMNLQIIIACGRGNILLALEMIKKIQLVLMILLTYRYGVTAMVWGLVATGPLSFVENAWFNRKLIAYSPWQQFLDILPIWIVTVIAGVFSFWVGEMFYNPWIQISIGGMVFAFVYLTAGGIGKIFPIDIMQLMKNRLFQYE